MSGTTTLTDRFEDHRGHLRAVAYRMLGSVSEAEDAVQEAWLRLSRTDMAEIDNLGGWLTTVVGRLCLDMLRSRREVPLDGRVPDPIISPESGADPEHEALLADSVGLALQVVIETLAPAERLAFVLHDMFAIPFDEIAPMLDRSPVAVRQLASRARRRVRDQAPPPDPDLGRQREAVSAFFAAARNGDLDALVAVLDPDVVLRADGGPTMPRLNVVVHGAGNVAGQAALAQRLSANVRPVLVNGTPGAVAFVGGQIQSVLSFTVVAGRIVRMEVLLDPARLAALRPGWLESGLDDDVRSSRADRG